MIPSVCLTPDASWSTQLGAVLEQFLNLCDSLAMRILPCMVNVSCCMEITGSAQHTKYTEEVEKEATWTPGSSRSKDTEVHIE